MIWYESGNSEASEAVICMKCLNHMEVDGWNMNRGHIDYGAILNAQTRLANNSVCVVANEMSDLVKVSHSHCERVA